MMRHTIAEQLVDTLATCGVRRIYGVAGDSLNGITDAIRRRTDIVWAPVRHEETAAFAAGAEAHLTGHLAVCAGSCGPGNLHLINGLFDAHRSRVPVLAIAAQIPTIEMGSGYFQETHPEILFRECSDYCQLVSEPGQLARTLEIAIRTALSRRGVSVLVLPGNVALMAAGSAGAPLSLHGLAPVIRPSNDELDKLAELLNGAAKVTILGGAGCAGAHDQLIELAGRLKSPIVHALRGKEFIEYDNPYDVGMTGLLGFSSGYHAMMNCDALLMLGTDFPYRQFYPQRAKVAQIDLRGEQIGKRTHVDLGLIGDVTASLAALLPMLSPKSDDAHLTASRAHYRDARKSLDDLAAGSPGVKPVHPQYVAKVLNELASDDAVFTCDVGTPTIWAARYLTMNGRRRLLGSFNHGSMANALPQAIGAQSAFPGRQVVTLSGDGGLAMLLGDLLTLKQLNLPVKIVVFKNDALAFVELEMKASGFLDYATELHNPDFAQLAKSAGVLGLRADTPEQVRPAISEALAHNGPALVEAVVARQELAMPPSIQLDQVRGFGLFLIQAILNGRGNELVALARENLLQ
jgi:pyruvate dehydrogenase (quinone)